MSILEKKRLDILIPNKQGKIPLDMAPHEEDYNLLINVNIKSYYNRLKKSANLLKSIALKLYIV